MDNNEVIQGGDLMLFVGGKSIAFATDHTLNLTAETRETSSKDDGGKWRNESYGKKSWTVTSNNLYANSGKGVTFKELVKYWIEETPVQVALCPKSETTDVAPEEGWTPNADMAQFVGVAIITTIDINAPNGDNASYSVTLNGKGKLNYTGTEEESSS